MERLAGGGGGRLQPCRGGLLTSRLRAEDRGLCGHGQSERTAQGGRLWGGGGQSTPQQTPQAVSRSAWGLRTAAQSVFAGIASGRVPTMRLPRSAQTL